METKHITRGEWEFKKFDGEQWPEKRWSVGTKDSAICISPRYFTEEEESIANAELIAESGTVTNECGLSPRQLLEQRNELLEVLKKLCNDAKILSLGESSNKVHVMVDSVNNGIRLIQTIQKRN